MADATNWWENTSIQPISTDTVMPSVGNLTSGLGSINVAPAISTPSWVQSLNNTGIFGSTAADGTKTQGWGTPALSLLSGLGSAYFGAQQLALAKDSLAAQKSQFAQNFAAQQKTTNAALSDRQNARVASNPGAYMSTADYMAKYGV